MEAARVELLLEPTMSSNSASAYPCAFDTKRSGVVFVKPAAREQTPIAFGNFTMARSHTPGAQVAAK